MRTDGHDELIVAFRTFANALKNMHCRPSQAKSVTYLTTPRLIRESKERAGVITSDKKTITSSVLHLNVHYKRESQMKTLKVR